MSGPNRAIYAKDCLDVLNDENAIPSESVDLIYLDPPFNSKSNYNLPFKSKEYKKGCKPVEAFRDTWSWDDHDEENLRKLKLTDPVLADLVMLARNVQRDRPGKKHRTDAYLMHMAVRLKEMRRVLKPTGSIYLHCDPHASHYLKLAMDSIFGEKNFRNEIAWCYHAGGASQNYFPRKHDVLLLYGKDATKTYHNPIRGVPYRDIYAYDKEGNVEESKGYHADGKMVSDWWEISVISSKAKERLGYPTQKPMKLLERIVTASAPEGALVLDPFCGCGTTAHAAEKLGRRWLGIDISPFSAGLIRERITHNFKNLSFGDIPVFGVPIDLAAAQTLARSDPFEFEKWACGAVGARGMYHPPGTRGADGGIDGVIPFYHSPRSYSLGRKAETTQAIVQVKGGRVSPDSVRALTQSIQETGSKCGVIVCFDQYMNTVENNRARGYFDDHEGRFPIVQGLSVERLLEGERPKLPRAA